mmetsp:Transcript_3613/g.10099  ORF Transcript_3613/g.10099 Transcript_3613/m.10099 type:complete len:84 (+) Transcript_3613:1192-1443(+)
MNSSPHKTAGNPGGKLPVASLPKASCGSHVVGMMPEEEDAWAGCLRSMLLGEVKLEVKMVVYKLKQTSWDNTVLHTARLRVQH